MAFPAIRSLWASILDLLLPPRCVLCGELNTWLCQECITQTPRVEPPFCIQCGGTDGASTSGLCSRCQTAPPRLQRIRSVFYFEGSIREAIHRLKYDGITVLAEPLGRLLSDYWLTHPMRSDMIVPVPLHRERVRQRGFNQAALLAYELSRYINVPVDDSTLVRHRATPSQVGLNVEQRKVNVRDAFRCRSDELDSKHVLLIDDVCTSGSTLEACAAALLKGGAKSVQALTLARAR